MNEIIRTTGDIRRMIAQTMMDVRNGTIEISRAQTIAQLSKEINSSLQTEVNVAKARLLLNDNGMSMGKVTQMGKLVIEDEGTVPTLDGTGK